MWRKENMMQHRRTRSSNNKFLCHVIYQEWAEERRESLWFFWNMWFLGITQPPKPPSHQCSCCQKNPHSYLNTVLCIPHLKIRKMSTNLQAFFAYHSLNSICVSVLLFPNLNPGLLETFQIFSGEESFIKYLFKRCCFHCFLEDTWLQIPIKIHAEWLPKRWQLCFPLSSSASEMDSHPFNFAECSL